MPIAPRILCFRLAQIVANTALREICDQSNQQQVLISSSLTEPPSLLCSLLLRRLLALTSRVKCVMPVIADKDINDARKRNKSVIEFMNEYVLKGNVDFVFCNKVENLLSVVKPMPIVVNQYVVSLETGKWKLLPQISTTRLTVAVNPSGGIISSVYPVSPYVYSNPYLDNAVNLARLLAISNELSMNQWCALLLNHLDQASVAQFVPNQIPETRDFAAMSANLDRLIFEITLGDEAMASLILSAASTCEDFFFNEIKEALTAFFEEEAMPSKAFFEKFKETVLFNEDALLSSSSFQDTIKYLRLLLFSRVIGLLEGIMDESGDERYIGVINKELETLLNCFSATEREMPTNMKDFDNALLSCLGS
jgi:hypothetical protein